MNGSSGERKARLDQIIKATGKCGYCPLHGGENARTSPEKHGGKRKDKK